MKRFRSAAAVCVLMIALVSAINAFAEDIVYFTAINNTILNLDKKTMPIKYKSMIYVPFKVFNSRDLGVYSIYSQSKQVVLLSDGEKSLYFDMLAGNSYDGEENEYSYSALFVNETAYIPAYFTSDFFGVGCSYLRSDIGHIIRLIKGDALPDSDFLSGAISIMEDKLEQFAEEQRPEPTPPPVQPTSSDRPTTPTVKPTQPPPGESSAPRPTVSPSVPTDDPVDRHDVSVFLSGLGLGEHTSGQIDVLKSFGFTACFFVEAEEVRLYPDVVRKIIGEGFGIGLLIRSDAESEYRAFSDALFEAAHETSFLAAAAPGLAEEDPTGIGGSSLKLWTIGRPADEYASCEALLFSAERECVISLSPMLTPNETERLCSKLLEDHYTVKQITTTEKALMNYAEISEIQ